MCAGVDALDLEDMCGHSMQSSLHTMNDATASENVQKVDVVLDILLQRPLLA